MLSFNLKSVIDGVNNPSVDGIFSYWGKVGSVYTLMDVYGYTDGTPYTTGYAFDSSKVLAWYSPSFGGQYPHIGFENLTPNANVEPQPFPNYGIYVHPGLGKGVVRMTLPFAVTADFVCKVGRSSFASGNKSIDFGIDVNGVSIHSQFLYAADGIVTVPIASSTYNAGDVIDFVIGYGTEDTDSDDTSLDVTLNFVLSKLPTPTLDVTTINCDTTSISGSVMFVEDGTTVNLYDGSTVVGTTTVSTPFGSYKGTFDLSPLNLGALGGKNLSLVLSNGSSEDSDPIVLSVENVGCDVDVSLEAPVVTKLNTCKKRCSYQRFVTGVSGYPDGTIVALYSVDASGNIPIGAPYNGLIGAGIVVGGTFSIGVSNLNAGRYRAVAISLDPTYTGSTAIELDEAQNCDKECVLVGAFSGLSTGIDSGIVVLYEDTPLLPTAVGVIQGGVWSILSDVLDGDYNMVSIELKNKV